MWNIKDDYDLIVRAWKILKEHHEIKQTPEYWDSLFDKAIKLSDHGILGQELSRAILNTIDRRDHNRKVGRDEW
jgi:hypothetical protein